MGAIAGTAGGLTLLVHVNWDRLLFLAGVAAALGAGVGMAALAS